MAGEYDMAQVCLNGHTANDSALRYPQHNAAFCGQCGEKTIVECPACRMPIRGRYRTPGVVTTAKYHPPAHCHACGAALPWTAARISAARELIEDLDELSDEEREKLAGTLDDLVSNTPRTQLAASRFKRLVGKAGQGAAEGLRSILVDVMSEAAKKVIFGA